MPYTVVHVLGIEIDNPSTLCKCPLWDCVLNSTDQPRLHVHVELVSAHARNCHALATPVRVRLPRY
jgi:hypothetical protein